jgi:hypothetical protein
MRVLELFGLQKLDLSLLASLMLFGWAPSGPMAVLVADLLIIVRATFAFNPTGEAEATPPVPPLAPTPTPLLLLT